jgi:hypothetical protein
LTTTVFREGEAPSEPVSAMEDLGSDDDTVSGEPKPTEVPIEKPSPIDELDLESLAPGSNLRFLAIIEEARAQCREGLGLSTEDVRRELGLR